MEKQRIEVNHVFKSFKEKEVLKDVSLTCESGKIYGIGLPVRKILHNPCPILVNYIIFAAHYTLSVRKIV